MEQNEADNSKANEIDKLNAIWRPTNPHDRFCRRTIFNPLYAPDFLKSYGDPVLLEFVDLDQLQEAPTTHLTAGLREVTMDASLTTRLLDTQSMSEVLFHLEHKSKPSQTATIQLFLEAALSLYFRWTLSNRPESGSFKPPIPLMVIVYNGDEDWDGEVWFQDLFTGLPEKLRQYVPQFRVFFINLQRFSYGNLPGRPETQAATESLKRATDGTFAGHLPGVFTHVAKANLVERLRLDLTQSISTYCTLVAPVTSEQITDAIRTVFKGQECLNMIEAIKNNFVLEGIEIGEARGIAIGEVKGEARGIAIGVDKGREIGESNKAHEIARNMKLKGFSAKDIADLTHLSLDEIEQLD